MMLVSLIPIFFFINVKKNICLRQTVHTYLSFFFFNRRELPRHDNVLKPVGISFRESKPHVLLPYIRGGMCHNIYVFLFFRIYVNGWFVDINFFLLRLLARVVDVRWRDFGQQKTTEPWNGSIIRRIWQWKIIGQ